MGKTYRFESFDDEDQTRTVIEFDTDNDAWSGYSGPMWNFFNFLKGCGFVFDSSSNIGVLDKNGNFHSADEDFTTQFDPSADFGVTIE